MKHPSPPLRHEPGRKNRRKALHFAENLRDEIEFLLRMRGNLLYCQDRVEKLINRLKSERRH
jgi:hypothetical protein